MNTLIFILISLFITHSAFGMGVYENFDSMLSEILNKSVPFMNADSLYALGQEKQSHVLLDTRKIEEFEVSHIYNAIHVGYSSFTLESVQHITKDTLIIVYCSVGYRSEKIGEQLIKNGYENVYNLYGGLFDWHNAGYPIYNDLGQTNEIHGYSKEWGMWINKGTVVY